MDDKPYLEIDEWKTRIWRNKYGQYHCLDGPAIERIDDLNNIREWWQNGKKHRLDGPATEVGGYKAWFKNGVKFPDKDTFFESLTEAEKEIALFSTNFFID